MCGKRVGTPFFKTVLEAYCAFLLWESQRTEAFVRHTCPVYTFVLRFVNRVQVTPHNPGLKRGA